MVRDLREQEHSRLLLSGIRTCLQYRITSYNVCYTKLLRETIFKRADLVKFAKSKPDIDLAKIDRNTIDIEIDHVQEALPEPTEEEKLLDLKYKEEQERKKKRKKIIITVVIVLFLLIGTFVGFSIKYGFNYVKDTIIA